MSGSLKRCFLLSCLAVFGASACSNDDEPRIGSDTGASDSGSDMGRETTDMTTVDARVPDAGDADTGNDAATDIDAGDDLLVATAFPPPLSATYHDQVLVRGTTVGGSAGVGVAFGETAAVSTDQFASWQATIDLQPGLNVLQGQATDLSGRVVDLPEIRITRLNRLRGAFGTAWDQANRWNYFVDREAQKLQRLDVATGALLEMADLADFSTAEANVPVDLALDTASSSIYVLSRDAAATKSIGVWRYDLQTSTWSETSTATRGSGPDWGTTGRITLNAAGDTAFVNDGVASAIFAVNLTTGDRTVLSSETVPNVDGNKLNSVADMDFDPVTNQIVVLDRAGNSVFGVDPTTGARTLISSIARGTGPEPTTGIGLGLDSVGGRAFMFTLSSPRLLLAIDLASGDRTQLTSSGLRDFRSLSYDSTIDGLVVVEAHLDTAKIVDVETGEQTEVNSNGFPDIVSNESMSGCEIAGGRFFGASDDTVYRMGPDNILTPVLGVGSTTGPLTGQIQYTASAVSGNILYILVEDADGTHHVVAYDSTNDSVSTLVTEPPDGTPLLVSARAMEVSDSGAAIYVANRQDRQIIKIDTTTGDVAVLSDSAIASDVELGSPRDISLNGENVLVVDDSEGFVIEVDAQTGVRTLSEWTTAPQTEVFDRASDGTFWMTAYDQEVGLYRLASTDTAPVLISDGTTPRGFLPGSLEPYFLASGPPLISCDGGGGVFQFDEVTGQMVILTQ